MAGVLFPILSADVLLEYEEVLARPKFLRQLDRSAILLEGLKEVSTLVHPADPLTVCADEGDNRILECALAGVAEFVITGT